MKKLIFSLFFFVLSSFVYAQTEFDKQKAINNQIQNMIDAFSSHVDYIKQNSTSNKEMTSYHIDATLDLFINKAEGLVDKNGETLLPPPRIEITDKKTGRTATYPIKKFLQALQSIYKDRNKFEIQKAQFYIIHDLKKISDDEYEAVLEYYSYSGKIDLGCSLINTKFVKIPWKGNDRNENINTHIIYVYIGDIKASIF